MFEKCSFTFRYYDKHCFPKKCNCCGLYFENREDYVGKTNTPNKGTFGTPRKGFIYEYRNCKCGSTLTVKFKDERDTSEEGDLKRAQIKAKIERLQKSGLNYASAKKKAIAEFFETYKGD